MPKQYNNEKKLSRDDNIENLGSKLKISVKDLLNNYTLDETKIIEDTKDFLISLWLKNINNHISPCYITTAGAPGVGKSYYIEQTELGCKYGNDYVYIDPDRIALKSIIIFLNYLNNADKIDLNNVSFNDYYNSIISNNKCLNISKDQYTKWRDASNYISNYMLLLSITLNVNIIHGTTSSNPKVANILKHLSDNSYNINIKLFQAPESSREDAINKRNQTVVQVSPEDAKNKLAAVYKNIPMYFDYATTIDFIMQQQDYSKKLDYSAIVCASASTNNSSNFLKINDENNFLRFNDNIEKECQDKDLIKSILNKINSLTHNNEIITAYNLHATSNPSTTSKSLVTSTQNSNTTINDSGNVTKTNLNFKF